MNTHGSTATAKPTESRLAHGFGPAFSCLNTPDHLRDVEEMLKQTGPVSISESKPPFVSAFLCSKL
jgi:hypothetical protein